MLLCRSNFLVIPFTDSFNFIKSSFTTGLSIGLEMSDKLDLLWVLFQKSTNILEFSFFCSCGGIRRMFIANSADAALCSVRFKIQWLNLDLLNYNVALTANGSFSSSDSKERRLTSGIWLIRLFVSVNTFSFFTDCSHTMAAVFSVPFRTPI